jgi:hypothetical protein
MASLDSAKTPSVTRLCGPGDEPAFLHQRLRTAQQPLVLQALHPAVKISHDALELGGREAAVPMRAADEQQVLAGGLLWVGIHDAGVSFVWRKAEPRSDSNGRISKFKPCGSTGFSDAMAAAAARLSATMIQ